MLYGFDRGFSAKESAQNIRNTYGEAIISEVSVRRWFCRFKKGDRTLEDQPREGRPNGVDDGALKKAVDKNPFLTVRELSKMFDCGPTAMFNHLKAIGKVKKRGRWLPHELTDKNKQDRSTRMV